MKSKSDNMYRNKTCGELNLSNVNEEVTLAGWYLKFVKWVE